MSWDIFVLDIPRKATRIADIPDDFEPQPIGARDEVIARIKEVVPAVDFDEQGWGQFLGDGFAIEISLGLEEPSMGFAFHVYGGGAAPEVISAILAQLALRAFNIGGGSDFLEPTIARQSFQEWQQYRDYVLSQMSDPPPRE